MHYWRFYDWEFTIGCDTTIFLGYAITVLDATKLGRTAYDTIVVAVPPAIVALTGLCTYP